MTIPGYGDRLCPRCRTFTQHAIVIRRTRWRCLNCDLEHGRPDAPARGAQATQRTPNGRVVRRWYVTRPDGRPAVTWAATRNAARIKCRDVGGFDPIVITPAPPVANMTIRDAFNGPADAPDPVRRCRACGEPESGGDFGWFDDADHVLRCVACGARPI